MTETTPTPEPKPPGSLAREVAVIVLVGIALGVGHNAYLLGSGPRAGLSWIKVERALAKLEDVLPAEPDPAMASQPAPSQPAANAPAGPATTTAKPAGGTRASSDRPAESTRPGGDPRPAPASEGASAPTEPPAPATASNPSASVPAASAPAATPPPADVPAIPETREPLETGLAVVRKLHAANAAVFVDARTAGEYAEGHIAGAVHLSFDDVFRDPELAKKLDDRGLPIVAYCGGGDCDLSRNLAFSLIDAGHRRVLVFLDGIAAWEQAGLPVNRGAQP